MFLVSYMLKFWVLVLNYNAQINVFFAVLWLYL